MSRPDWDPGWGGSIRSALQARRGATTLGRARLAWLAFFVSHAFIWWGLAAVVPWAGGDAGIWPLLIVAGGVALHLALVPWIHRRMSTVSTSSDHGVDLVVVYRTAMFLGIAYSQSVSTWAFVAAITTGSAWLYVLSLPFALLGLVRVAPSQRTFARLDELLQQQGSPLRMTEAWRRTTDPAIDQPPR